MRKRLSWPLGWSAGFTQRSRKTKLKTWREVRLGDSLHAAWRSELIVPALYKFAAPKKGKYISLQIQNKSKRGMWLPIRQVQTWAILTDAQCAEQGRNSSSALFRTNLDCYDQCRVSHSTKGSRSLSSCPERGKMEKDLGTKSGEQQLGATGVLAWVQN